MTGSTPRSMRSMVQRFRDDEQAATAIEYALIAAGIGMTIASTVYGLGANLKATWWDKVGALFG